MSPGIRVRIGLAAALLGAAGAASPQIPRPPQTVVIVTTSAVDAFQETVAGIRRELGPVKSTTIDLDSQPALLAEAVTSREVRVVITVGNNALQAVSRLSTAPVVATMILRADLAQAEHAPAAAVVLDVSLAEVMSGLERAFPGKTRAGMIRNPALGGPPAAALTAQAKAAGVTLKVIDCPRPEQLLHAFESLRSLVDFVWCPPDGSLYNGTTVKPLIVASLENRLPVAGFSAAFVRAGAMAGVYPDYGEMGIQAGEAARKILAGGAQEISPPRKIRVATNPKVARLLGLRLPIRNGDDQGIVVIE